MEIHYAYNFSENGYEGGSMTSRNKIILLTMLLIAGTFTLLPGCRGGMMIFNADRSEIQSADPAVRIRAIIHATRTKDAKATPLIVDRLEDEDEAVRIVAIESLKQLTGKDFGYKAYDPPYVRSAAVERWRSWVKDQGKEPAANHPDNTKKEVK
jgi:hypothetical protein